MPDFFNDPDWEVTHAAKRMKGGRGKVIQVRCRAVPTVCPKCGISGKLISHGKIEVQLKPSSDRPAGAKDFRDRPDEEGPLVIRVVERKRFKCKSCDIVSIQPLPGMDERHRMTTECVDYILAHVVRLGFEAVADEVGVDESTVRTLFHERYRGFRSKGRIFAPRALGIAEVKVGSRWRVLYVDLQNAMALDLGDDREKASVRKWLTRLTEQERVEVVCIGLVDRHRELLKSRYGHSLYIMTDKTSVLDLAERCLAKVRASTSRSKKPACTARRAAAEAAKTAFDDIYLLKGSFTARHAFTAWQKALPETTRKDFAPLVTVLTDWRREITNYFDPELADAYSETMAELVLKIRKSGRKFAEVKARVLERSVIRPPQNSRRCRRCRGIIQTGTRRKRHYPVVLSKVRPQLRDELLEICESCHRGHMIESYGIKSEDVKLFFELTFPKPRRSRITKTS